MRSIFISEHTENLNKVYGPDTRACLQAEAGLELVPYTRDMIMQTPEAFQDVDFIFSLAKERKTWTFLSLSDFLRRS